MEKGKFPQEIMPATSDPRWREWASPLLEYLNKEPRTWKQLETWQKCQCVSGTFLRSCLAWLEEMGDVRSEDHGHEVTWQGVKHDVDADLYRKKV